MAPALRGGDLLLVSYAAAPRVGAIVVARFPGKLVVVKRAAGRRALPDGTPGWWLLSDNEAEGIDSRHRGAIAEDDLIGVVLARVWPRPRLLAGSG